MPSEFIECPSCGWEGEIDEGLIGRKIKCPKCATSFEAEAGGAYDLAGEPAGSGRPKSREEPGPEEEADGPADSAEPPKSWLGDWPAE